MNAATPPPTDEHLTAKGAIPQLARALPTNRQWRPDIGRRAVLTEEELSIASQLEENPGGTTDVMKHHGEYARNSKVCVLNSDEAVATFLEIKRRQVEEENLEKNRSLAIPTSPDEILSEDFKNYKKIRAHQKLIVYVPDPELSKEQRMDVGPQGLPPMQGHPLAGEGTKYGPHLVHGDGLLGVVGTGEVGFDLKHATTPPAKDWRGFQHLSPVGKKLPSKNLLSPELDGTDATLVQHSFQWTGRGVFATKDIAEGEVVMVVSSTAQRFGLEGEQRRLAHMVGDILFDAFHGTAEDREFLHEWILTGQVSPMLDRWNTDLTEEVIQRLGGPSALAALELHPIHIARLAAIIDLNSFVVESAYAERQGAAYWPEAQFFNHSCMPNVSYDMVPIHRFETSEFFLNWRVGMEEKEQEKAIQQKLQEILDPNDNNNIKVKKEEDGKDDSFEKNDDRKDSPAACHSQVPSVAKDDDVQKNAELDLPSGAGINDKSSGAAEMAQRSSRHDPLAPPKALLLRRVRALIEAESEREMRRRSSLDAVHAAQMDPMNASAVPMGDQRVTMSSVSPTTVQESLERHSAMERMRRYVAENEDEPTKANKAPMSPTPPLTGKGSESIHESKSEPVSGRSNAQQEGHEATTIPTKESDGAGPLLQQASASQLQDVSSSNNNNNNGDIILDFGKHRLTADTAPVVLFCVKAQRPIKAGEEMLLTYVPPEWRYDIRQSVLFDRYKFRCRCPKCMPTLDRNQNLVAYFGIFCVVLFLGMNILLVMGPRAAKRSFGTDDVEDQNMITDAAALLQEKLRRLTSTAGEAEEEGHDASNNRRETELKESDFFYGTKKKEEGEDSLETRAERRRRLRKDYELIADTSSNPRVEALVSYLQQQEKETGKKK